MCAETAGSGDERRPAAGVAGVPAASRTAETRCRRRRPHHATSVSVVDRHSYLPHHAARRSAHQATGLVFSARCNIYISRFCYDVSVSVCLSVRLSVTEVHWRIIANLGFKFRSQFTAHCGRGACGREGRDHRREEWKDHLALC